MNLQPTAYEAGTLTIELLVRISSLLEKNDAHRDEHYTELSMKYIVLHCVAVANTDFFALLLRTIG